PVRDALPVRNVAGGAYPCRHVVGRAVPVAEVEVGADRHVAVVGEAVRQVPVPLVPAGPVVEQHHARVRTGSERPRVVRVEVSAVIALDRDGLRDQPLVRSRVNHAGSVLSVGPVAGCHREPGPHASRGPRAGTPGALPATVRSISHARARLAMPPMISMFTRSSVAASPVAPGAVAEPPIATTSRTRSAGARTPSARLPSAPPPGPASSSTGLGTAVASPAGSGSSNSSHSPQSIRSTSNVVIKGEGARASG